MLLIFNYMVLIFNYMVLTRCPSLFGQQAFGWSAVK